MIFATCPTCRCRLRAPETFANQRVKCPRCQAAFTVPNPKVASTPPPVVIAAPAIESVAEAAPPVAFGPSRGWRYLSSPWVVMTFLFGFLPWCEVSCSSRDSEVRLTQSGYQALYGGVSAPPAMTEMLVKEAEQRQSSLSVRQTRQGLHQQLGVERSYLANVSPFLVFFWGANFALIGLICFVPLGGWRLGFALPLCGILLGVLVLHACIGLPLERRLGSVLAKAIHEDASEGMFLLAAFKTGKTVWFWLTLASVVFLAMTEPLLNWLRAEHWGGWLVPSSITGGAASLMLMGIIVQFAVRETIVSDLENRIAQLRKVEEEKRQKAEAERRRRQEEHLAEVRRREAEAERLRQQAALMAEKARLEEQRRLREQEEAERQRQKEREQEERRAMLERRRQEAEAQRRAEQEAKEEAEREAARKADLEKKGQPYYPRPRTSYNGRTADEWAQAAIRDIYNYRNLAEAAEALAALKEEGMPYLLDLLRRQKTIIGRKTVLQRLRAEYIHPNDLSKLMPFLERNRALETETRILALRCLHKRAEHLKDLLPKIEASMKDLLIVSIYKEEIKNILDDIREKTK